MTSLGTAPPPPLCQVAFSVTDLRRTDRWYREMFGFVPAGGTRTFRGPIASRVQGLPSAASTCWWLVDRQDFFQLELFQFERPRPADCQPCDVGYARVGLHVADFDAVYARALAAGYRGNWRPLNLQAWAVVYLNDDQGFSVELLFVRPWYDGRMGFQPRPSRARGE